MSKSDAPLEAIDTSAVQRDLRTPKWLAGAKISAMDFETADGDPFMLAVSEPDRSYVIEPENRSNGIEAERLIGTLAASRFAGNHIVLWYNLGFDAEIFTRSLGAEAATELYLENQTEYETADGRQIGITYIPGKLLRFDLPGSQTVEHYDIGNIVRGGLEAGASEWLNESDAKANEGLEADRFGDVQYRRDRWNEIREYAEQDANLTRRLADAVLSKAEAVGIPARKPISTGSLAVSWLASELDTKPGWGPTPVQSLAWEAFAGGRFEVFERGAVGEVAGPDINSAYPAVMADLPDPGTLAWNTTSGATLTDIRDADYGFVRATVTTDAARRIQPFAVKQDGIVTYPACNDVQVTTLRETFVHAVEAGYVESFSIDKVSLGYETDVTEFPFAFLRDVYDERKELEANGRELAGLMLKIVLNSLYGKTAQTTLKRSVITEETTPAEAASDPCERFKSLEGIPYVERQEAGSLFNPFLASYITGQTRLELHKAVTETGLEDETVMFATDCIMVHADAYDASDFDNRLGDTLGEWDFDYRGDAFVVGSGVYEVDTGEGLKKGTRGFREADFESLRDAAADATDSLPLETTRPVTLGEAVARGSTYELADIGEFLTTSRDLRPDFDRKRNWSETPTFRDLTERSYYGPPRVLEGD